MIRENHLLVTAPNQSMVVIILKIGYKKTIEASTFKNFSHYDLLYFDFSTIVPSQFGQLISYPLP